MKGQNNKYVFGEVPNRKNEDKFLGFPHTLLLMNMFFQSKTLTFRILAA